MDPVQQYEIIVVGYTSPTGLPNNLILPDGKLKEGDTNTMLDILLTLVCIALNPRICM